MENISFSADVDGHDIGSGQMNIFIFTDSPNDTLNEVLRILNDDKKITSEMKVAYHEVSNDHFVCLWPKNLTEFSVL